MPWQLYDSPKYWQNGPVLMSQLRQEHAMLVAMGNAAGANCVKAQLDEVSERWAKQSAQHAPVYVTPKAPRELKAGDTQGM